MSIRIIPALFLLLILVTTQIGFAQPAASWVEVGAGSATFPGGVGPNDNAQWPSLAIAPDGTPYVAYIAAAANAPSRLYIRKFDGMNWVEVGAGSASGDGINTGMGTANDVAIAIAPDGTPYVLWQDLTYSRNYDIYIKRFNGTMWVEVGASSATGGGISNTDALSQFPALAIASDSTLYAAWQESTSPSGIYIRKFDGANWVEVGTGSASGSGIGTGSEPSLAIGSNGLPTIAYSETSGANTTDIYVKRFNGITWVDYDNESASAGGISDTFTTFSQSPSLVFAPDGTPYVVWSEVLDGASQIYVRRFNGTNWVEAGAGSATGDGITNYPLLQEPFHTGFPVLTVDAIGVAYAAWYYLSPSTSTVIHARRFAGGIWEEIPAGSATGAGIISAPWQGSGPSLAIHPLTNLPYIAWFAAEFPPSNVIGVFVRRLDSIPPTPLPPTPTPLPPTLTTPALPNGMVGINYQQALTVSNGTQPYTFSVVQGVLPNGLSLHSRSGIISGTPTQAGSFTLMLQMVDNIGRSSAQTYTLVIAPAVIVPITLAPTSLPVGTVGVPYQALISAQGGTGSGYTFAITQGALPSGLTMNAFGSISGTPTALDSSTFSVIALDSGGNTGSATFTLTIAPPDALSGH